MIKSIKHFLSHDINVSSFQLLQAIPIIVSLKEAGALFREA